VSVRLFVEPIRQRRWFPGLFRQGMSPLCFRPASLRSGSVTCATQQLCSCLGIASFLKARKKISLSPDHSEIVVGEEPAVIVVLKPIVEVNLIEVRSNDLFAQFVGLSAQEGNL